MPFYQVACFHCGTTEDLKLFLLKDKNKNVTVQIYACNKHLKELQLKQLEVRFYYKGGIVDGNTKN